MIQKIEIKKNDKMVFLTKRHDLNNSSPLLFINLLQFSAVSSAINIYMHIKICLSMNRILDI